MKGVALPCHVIYEWGFFFGFDYLLHYLFIFPLMPPVTNQLLLLKLSNN